MCPKHPFSSQILRITVPPLSSSGLIVFAMRIVSFTSPSAGRTWSRPKRDIKLFLNISIVNNVSLDGNTVLYQADTSFFMIPYSASYAVISLQRLSAVTVSFTTLYLPMVKGTSV